MLSAGVWSKGGLLLAREAPSVGSNRSLPDSAWVSLQPAKAISEDSVRLTGRGSWGGREASQAADTKLRGSEICRPISAVGQATSDVVRGRHFRLKGWQQPAMTGNDRQNDGNVSYCKINALCANACSGRQ